MQLALVGPYQAAAIPHAPHNSLSCADCHTDPLPDTNRSDICLTCHNGVSAPLALTHSNEVIHGGQPPLYAGLSFACLDCHDPHFHYQLVNLPDLFLVTATIEPGSIVDNGNSTSTLSYSAAVIKSGWNLPPHADNADWGAKTAAGRGLVLVADKDIPDATYEIVSATTTQLIVNGVMSTSFEGNTFGIMYGMLINDTVDPDGEGGSAPVTVRFYNKSGTNSFADGDGTHDGICEVCHTLTDHFRADGSAPEIPETPGDGIMEHTAGTNCTSCHTHKMGFGLSGSSSCGSCHPNWGSHPTHTEADCGPKLACYDCHDTSSYPLLRDGQDLDNTTVCDPCHSASGSYNGVDSGGDSIGARDNWVAGVYDGGMDIQAGKERWCVGCHDDVPALIQGVSAPNVAGDDIGYGYYQTGHGKHGNEQAIGCLDCHDAAMAHTDGEARTYAAAADNYQAGYRLKDIDGQAPMDIPRGGATTADQFCLCFNCHDSAPFLDRGNTDTNFRSDVDDACTPLDPAVDNVNKHNFHLASGVVNIWDSDWDGETGNSKMSCPACHNVHGAKPKAGASNAPAMIRTGDLIGRPDDALNLDYFVSECDESLTYSTSNETTSSTGGMLKWQGMGAGAIAKNGVCTMCHNENEPYWREAKDIVGCSSNSCHTTGSHSTHVTSTADSGLIGLGCEECHNTDDFPRFKDGQDLAGTAACDHCHSTDGVALAKQYWDTPGSSTRAAGSWAVEEGEQSFCGSCHDGTPGNSQSNGLGDDAFNIIGDNVAYGFYVTGHGRTSSAGPYPKMYYQDEGETGNPAADLQSCITCHGIPPVPPGVVGPRVTPCSFCHDIAAAHFDNPIRRLRAGFENDQANTNCNKCHPPGTAATSDPELYADSAEYEAAAHGAKFCTDCHEVHGASTGADPAMAKDGKRALCLGCHYSGNPEGLPVPTDPPAEHAAGSTTACSKCHNPHRAAHSDGDADCLKCHTIH